MPVYQIDVQGATYSGSTAFIDPSTTYWATSFKMTGRSCHTFNDASHRITFYPSF
jgi:hypothetical protein